MKFIALICLLLFSYKSEWYKLSVLSYTINEQGIKEFYSSVYNGDFLNQMNDKFTNEHLNNKVIIANFFFTRCPSICPPMRQQLIGISESIDDDDLLIISPTMVHSLIDAPDESVRFKSKHIINLPVHKSCEEPELIYMVHTLKQVLK